MLERSQALIDLGALRANFEVARAHAGGCDVISVVKADAYGHGAGPVALALEAAGCSRFAVVTLEEAVRLREAGVASPILVLGGVLSPSAAEAAVAHSLTPVLHDPTAIQWLDAAGRGECLGVQIEVDTGMHRMGVPVAGAMSLANAVAASKSLTLQGIYTHLARADEPDLGPSRQQLDAFQALLQELRRSGVDPEWVHFANSAGLLVGEPLREHVPTANAVRPGLMLYGARPAPHQGVELRPVMTFGTRVAQVRDLPRGAAVGYAALFRAERDTRVATLPVGYEDGIPISASNTGSVCIRGRRFPIVGRVSMDFITVDVGDAPVVPGDEVIVFGGSGDRVRSVDEAAADAGTIAHELLVRVGARVPRVYVG
jgi:alanine racemase